MVERKIIGLVGPSAVGKGYSKEAIKTCFPEFIEPVVVTTREKRTTDGIDRRAGIPIDEFIQMRESGSVIFAHQPFGEETDWYGFDKVSLDDIKKPILTEIHVQNIKPFKERYGHRVQLIALIASNEYLEKNIRNRATESEDNIQIRLRKAISEVETIKKHQSEGLIDYIIEVSDSNRETLAQMVIEITKKILN